jgi:hypothetical protein
MFICEEITENLSRRFEYLSSGSKYCKVCVGLATEIRFCSTTSSWHKGVY